MEIVAASIRDVFQARAGHHALDDDLIRLDRQIVPNISAGRHMTRKPVTAADCEDTAHVERDVTFDRGVARQVDVLIDGVRPRLDDVVDDAARADGIETSLAGQSAAAATPTVRETVHGSPPRRAAQRPSLKEQAADPKPAVIATCFAHLTIAFRHSVKHRDHLTGTTAICTSIYPLSAAIKHGMRKAESRLAGRSGLNRLNEYVSAYAMFLASCQD